MNLPPWWERWQGLLEEELRALDRAGIGYELDEAARRKHGVIQLRVYPEVDGRRLELVATYSDLFPYFRFEVHGDDLGLPHHQHPFGGNLCLIGRSTENWDVDDTLADFLTSRLPRTLSAGASESAAEVAGVEEHQAEPFSDYYPYPLSTVLLVDGGWEIRGPGGRLTVGLEEVSVPGMVRGAVLEVQDEAGRVLASADAAIREIYPIKTAGRWIRSPAAIREGNASSFIDALSPLQGRLAAPLWQRVGSARIDIVGVIFPEEVAWREASDGWVFVVRYEAR